MKPALKHWEVDRTEVVRYHVNSAKHEQSIATMLIDAKNMTEITKYINHHGPVTKVDEKQTAYRMEVTEAMLYSGVPFWTMGHRKSGSKMRTLLERGRYRLGTDKLMSSHVKYVKDRYIRGLLKLFHNSQPTSHTFDGACTTAESLCMISRMLVLRRREIEGNVRNRFVIVQKLTNFEFVDKPPTGLSIAGYVNSSLEKLSITSDRVSAIISDRCSVNMAALDTLGEMNMYKNSVHIPCYSHSLAIVGNKISSPVATRYLKAVTQAFAHSNQSRFFFKTITGQVAVKKTIRWFSNHAMADQQLVVFQLLPKFWSDIAARKLCEKSVMKAKAILQSPNEQHLLALELSLIVDLGDHLKKVCDFFQGDSFLAPFVYRMASLKTIIDQFDKPQFHPNVSIVCEKIATTMCKPKTTAWNSKKKQFEAYALELALPARRKFNKLFGTNGVFQGTLNLFRAARLLQPCHWNSFQSEIDANVLNFFRHLSKTQVVLLKRQLPDYLVIAQHVVHMDPPALLQWWANVPPEISEWAALVPWMAVCQPSSASVERAFGIIGSLIGDDQKSMKEDKVFTTAMLRFNAPIHRKKRKKKMNNGDIIVQNGGESPNLPANNISLLKPQGDYSPPNAAAEDEGGAAEDEEEEEKAIEIGGEIVKCKRCNTKRLLSYKWQKKSFTCDMIHGWSCELKKTKSSKAG